MQPALEDFIRQLGQSEKISQVKLINASDWLRQEPPPPDCILTDVFDTGDKLAIIGPSKVRKSFFLMQMALSLSVGRPFLKWGVPKARRVLLCQFEIRKNHAHRRLKKIAKAMGITPEEIDDRLQVLNARGFGISGPEDIKQILAAVDFKPEVIILDPLYKLSTGVENAAEDMKLLLAEFDQWAEESGAAIIFVHHDAKGTPGDRAIIDRGAGSNVLGRDYDACFALTSHVQAENAVVVDILLRNYKPQESFTIMWDYTGDGFCFQIDGDLLPDKKCFRTRQTFPALSTYLPAAQAIFNQNGQNLDVAIFKTLFKEKTGLSDNRIRGFLNWAQAGGAPYIEATEERGRGRHLKTLSFVRCDV